MDQVKEIVQDKVSKEDLKNIEATKGSKIDQEMTLRWIDLLHKMVKSIM